MKMSRNNVYYWLTNSIFASMYFLLLLGSFLSSAASEKDKLTWTLQTQIVEAQLLTAGHLSELNQYRLENPWTTDADSLFSASFQTYIKLYNQVAPEERKTIFTLSFYERITPAVQRFRNAGAIMLLTEHQELLHPAPPVPDPKHDQYPASEHQNHNHQ